MSEIAVDPLLMERLFKKVIDDVDRVDAVLPGVPDAPDGGIASELIGFTVAAAVEGGAMTADSYRALIAVARDVIEDFARNEEAALAELQSLRRGIDGG